MDIVPTPPSDSPPDIPIDVKEEELDSYSQPSCSEEVEEKPLIKPGKEAKKRRQEQAPLSCDICGEPTNTYHYEVASCNGCRTFFRRTLMLGRIYYCMTGGRCPPEIYRSCRACRFDRCILSGMNLDAIKFSKTVDVDLISQAISLRRKELLCGSLDIPFKYQLEYPGTSECFEIDSLVYAEGKCLSLRENIDPVVQYTEGLRANLTEPIRLGNVGRLQRAGTDFETKCHFLYQGRQLDFKGIGPGRNWIGIDLFLCVELAKTLPAFEKLSLDDRTALIANIGLANMMLARAFYSVSQRSTVVVFPGGNLPMLPMLETGLESEVFCRVLEPIVRVGLSLEEYVLLKAIIYCNAEAPGLSPEGSAILKEERERYGTLLMHHMQRRLGSSLGAAKYAEVVSLVGPYFHFGQRYWEHLNRIGIALSAKTGLRLSLHGRYQLIEDVLYGHSVGTL